MRFVLVTPPFFVPTGGAAAPSVLAALLQEAGHDAVTFDVSRFCVQHLLDRSALEKSLRTVPHAVVAPELATYLGEILPYSLEDSVVAMQSESGFGSFEAYRRAGTDLELAMFVHAKAHGHSVWSSTGFNGNHDRTDPHDLLRAVAEGGELLDDCIADAASILVESRPAVVAISVSFADQLYGALRLAHQIRARAPFIHICLGGATVTRLRRAFSHLPELFDIVDSIIVREGETPLIALAAALSEKQDPLNAVSGLFARRNGHVVSSIAGGETSGDLGKAMPSADRPERPRRLKNLPFPVFDELVPGPYLSPCPILPLSTTRNCYFDKCPFCAISRSFSYGYDEMPEERMAAQIHHLRSLHPGAVFKDVSEALPPKLAFAFAEKMAASNEVAPWEAYFRFENQFASAAAGRQLRRGGLRVAYFGLESASPRLLGEMNKHIEIEAAERTIRTFAEEGIWVHLFLMAGYATETEADHYATLEFLGRNAPYIHSVQTSAFLMELDSDIVRLSDRHGFTIRKRCEPSFSLSVALDRLGDIPPPEIAQHRVNELRRVAYHESGPVLAASRHIWDGHKIVFTVQQEGPSLPGLENPAVLHNSQSLQECYV